MISRYSEEPRRHEDNHNAIRISLHRTSPTILASGATVAAALLTLSVAEVNGAAGRVPDTCTTPTACARGGHWRDGCDP